MTDRERPLLADLRQQIAAAAADLGELLALRWELRGGNFTPRWPACGVWPLRWPPRP